MGLELARKLSPDVVLLDLMLPDINGFDVCRQLRSDRATMLTPVVMLTALGDADEPDPRLPGRRQRLRDQALRHPRAVRCDRDCPRLAGRDGPGGHAGGDPRRAEQRDHPAPGPQRLPDEPLPVHPVHERTGDAAAPGGHGDGTERDRMGQPASVGPAGQHHLPGLRGPGRDRRPRPGHGLRPRTTYPTPQSRTTRSRTSTSATSSASAPGGSA